MGTVSKSRRFALAEAQNWRCAYCTVGLEPNGARGAIVDHILPRRVGGLAVWPNLVCACFECNSARGSDIDASAFWALRDRLRDSGLWLPGRPPPAEVAALLRAHRAYAQAKVALRRRARQAQAAFADSLVAELVEVLETEPVIRLRLVTRDDPVRLADLAANDRELCEPGAAPGLAIHDAVPQVIAASE